MPGRLADIARYLDRDWALVAASKPAYLRALRERMGPDEMLRLSEELRLAAKATRPGWPSNAERAADLAAHVRLSELLRRASSDRPR